MSAVWAQPAQSSWGLLLATGPAMFLVSFAIVFWAARGFAALRYIVRLQGRRRAR